jgi:diphosphomevalonate decarboxylase
MDECRQAILMRDIDRLAEIAELDCNMMHAVMMTSSPPLIYWQPTTLAIIQAVTQWRRQGTPVFYTIDAGPNVHVICLKENTSKIKTQLLDIPGVKQVLTAPPGGAGEVIDYPK